MAANDREIERKYLLRALPDRVRSATSVEVDQGYLPGTRINEPIRRMRWPDGARFYRTIKMGAGLDRLELEDETNEQFFSTVWLLTRGARIYKRRYFVPEGDVTWEIDEFLDRSGLWLAEVELETADQRVEIPAWLGAVLEREVTDEKEYTNHALAR